MRLRLLALAGVLYQMGERRALHPPSVYSFSVDEGFGGPLAGLSEECADWQREKSVEIQERQDE
jgi:hypothetical protein